MHEFTVYYTHLNGLDEGNTQNQNVAIKSAEKISRDEIIVMNR